MVWTHNIENLREAFYQPELPDLVLTYVFSQYWSHSNFENSMVKKFSDLHLGLNLQPFVEHWQRLLLPWAKQTDKALKFFSVLFRLSKVKAIKIWTNNFQNYSIDV